MYITVEDPKRMKKSDYFIYAIILIILLSFVVVIYRLTNTQSKFNAEEIIKRELFTSRFVQDNHYDLFLGESAISDNYSINELYEINKAIKDESISDREINWWIMMKLKFYKDLNKINRAGIRGITAKEEIVRKEIADEMSRISYDFKELFVGENALKGNYSKAQLNEIKEAIKDNVLSKDEVGWMDFAEIESNGDFETLAKAGVSVIM